jgi:hypothetical protein
MNTYIVWQLSPRLNSTKSPQTYRPYFILAKGLQLWVSSTGVSLNIFATWKSTRIAARFLPRFAVKRQNKHSPCAYCYFTFETERTLIKCAYFWNTEEGTNLQTPALNGAPVSPNSDVRTGSLFVQLKLPNKEVLLYMNGCNVKMSSLLIKIAQLKTNVIRKRKRRQVQNWIPRDKLNCIFWNSFSTKV